MNTIYPMEEKQVAPPTYEQAIYHAVAMPPGSTAFPSTSPYINTNPPMPYPVAPPPPTIGPGFVYQTSQPSMNYQTPPVGTQMVITTQALLYGDVPIRCICPHCQHDILTRIEKRSGLAAWLACGGILLFGCWLGCCLIPFCVDGLKDTEHYCPHCAILLGTRRRM